MAKKQFKLWEAAAKLLLIKDISYPIMIGFSSIGSLLSTRVPLISALGWFGIFCSFIIFLLIISIIARIQARTKSRIRDLNIAESERFQKIILWKGWQWIFLAICLCIDYQIFDSRPRLPAGMSPTEIILPIASYREMNEDKIVGKTVFITDVPRILKDPMTIKNKEFDYCIIRGPAVISITGATTFTSSVFGTFRSFDDILLESKSGVMVGMIFLNGCKFNSCRFEYISFAGSESTIDKFRQNVNSPIQ